MSIDVHKLTSGPSFAFIGNIERRKRRTTIFFLKIHMKTLQNVENITREISQKEVKTVAQSEYGQLSWACE